MGCCQCHDHKFDPFSMNDFYSMAAFFADVQEASVGRREPGMPVPDEEQAAKLRTLEDALSAAKIKAGCDLRPSWPRRKSEWESKSAKAARLAGAERRFSSRARRFQITPRCGWHSSQPGQARGPGKTLRSSRIPILPASPDSAWKRSMTRRFPPKAPGTAPQWEFRADLVQGRALERRSKADAAEIGQGQRRSFTGGHSPSKARSTPSWVAAGPFFPKSARSTSRSSSSMSRSKNDGGRGARVHAAIPLAQRAP